METINEDPLDYISTEKVYVLYCCGGDEIQVVGVEVWFNRHNIPYMLPQGL